jgi:ABC-2 type transport system ATP-binding protein
MQAIEVRHLSKHFGPLHAVEDVSFTVERGSVLGFLGPNGAGKSTTMKMIACFLEPNGGTIRVWGFDVLDRPIQVKERIGYLPEGAPLYGEMTPTSFLNFIADIRKLKGQKREERLHDVVSKIHLESVMEQRIETLSKGYKRRVGLAQAILHNPEVLILDEPTDGLDPNQKYEVRTLIKAMAKDKAIIISTHILEEVHAVCTQAIIIAQGRLLFDGTPAELEARSRLHNAVALSVKTEAAAAAKKHLAELSVVAQVDEVEMINGSSRLLIFPKNGKAIVGAVSDLVRAQGWEVSELQVEPGRLDEVFRVITTGSNPVEVRS